MVGKTEEKDALTHEEAEARYGKEMLGKMLATGELNCVTAFFTEDGKSVIPLRDYEIAYRAANGGRIHLYEWD